MLGITVTKLGHCWCARKVSQAAAGHHTAAARNQSLCNGRNICGEFPLGYQAKLKPDSPPVHPSFFSRAHSALELPASLLYCAQLSSQYHEDEDVYRSRCTDS